METFNKTKMFKRITLILVFLILFNFSYPTVVRAGIDDLWDDIVAGVENALKTYITNPIKALFAKLLAYAITRNMSWLICSRRCNNGFGKQYVL